MEKDTLIKKWLDNTLSTEELVAFKQLDDYEELQQLNKRLKAFKAPEFSIESEYTVLKSKLKAAPKKTLWLAPLLKIAAIIAICFSVYYYTSTLDTTVQTQLASSTNINLPDRSEVLLNSNSTVTFNKKQWDTKREVMLEGEAFFKVAQGEKFDVVTKNGVISVLGTQFNVKQRQDYFEVTCFEGLVSVETPLKTLTLHPQECIKIIDGKLIANEKEITAQPNWILGETSFKNIPLKHVIAELENYYDIDVSVDAKDASRLFSGSFTHKNLELALQSITIPLNLSYSKSKTSIVLKRE